VESQGLKLTGDLEPFLVRKNISDALPRDYWNWRSNERRFVVAVVIYMSLFCKYLSILVRCAEWEECIYGISTIPARISADQKFIQDSSLSDIER
jgi:hypothetical protein